MRSAAAEFALPEGRNPSFRCTRTAAQTVLLIYSRRERAKSFLRLVFQTRQLAYCFGHCLWFGAKCRNPQARAERAALRRGPLSSFRRDTTRNARPRPAKSQPAVNFVACGLRQVSRGPVPFQLNEPIKGSCTSNGILRIRSATNCTNRSRRHQSHPQIAWNCPDGICASGAWAFGPKHGTRVR